MTPPPITCLCSLQWTQHSPACFAATPPVSSLDYSLVVGAGYAADTKQQPATTPQPQLHPQQPQAHVYYSHTGPVQTSAPSALGRPSGMHQGQVRAHHMWPPRQHNMGSAQPNMHHFLARGSPLPPPPPCGSPPSSVAASWEGPLAPPATYIGSGDPSVGSRRDAASLQSVRTALDPPLSSLTWGGSHASRSPAALPPTPLIGAPAQLVLSPDQTHLFGHWLA